MDKNLLAIAGLCMLPALSFAQNTETFEGVTASGTVKPTVFVNNSQSFTISVNDCSQTGGGTFGVFIPGQSYLDCNSGSHTSTGSGYGVGTSCSGGNCTGTSNKFIDNGSSNGTSQIYGIKTTNAALFTIKSMFVFLSADHAVTPSAAGGITIVGKKANVTQFTYTKTTGFNSSFGTNNGFTYLDFSVGTNYTNINIDELQIQGGNLANYLAIDNFTWGSSVALPLGLLSFDAKQEDGNVLLNWKMANDADFSWFRVEHGTDGKSFTSLGNIAADKSSTYAFNDNRPVTGNNFYRLAMISKSGAVSYSDVRIISVASVKQHEAFIYPNPVSEWLFVDINGGDAVQIQITDFTGRVVAIEKLYVGSKGMNLGHLKSGVYFYTATDVYTNKVMAQGKITKL